MLFNSYEFIFVFLPIVLIGYYALRAHRARMLFLTLMSYVFYGWWDFRFCALMLISTVLDYVAGARVAAATDEKRRKWWVAVSLIGNLGLLGFFKYYDLGAQTINHLAAWLGTETPWIPLLRVTLPVGISFYTFQSMSYTIDIYRGCAKPARDFLDFACYVSLFPQLVAGPIVRYHEIADQLLNRTHTIQKAARGVSLFIVGLAKKVILADGVAPVVSHVFDGAVAPGVFAAWGGVVAYAMQIYFDFSGYSDMAVGLGLFLGFEFPQNFNSPYKALSITDFWRRWHMSLSSWLRDYLYVPLGGNRHGRMRTYVNLFITMLLGGLWHGANWTFVIWGGYHGVLLALERAAGKRSIVWWAPRGVQRVVTFGLVLVGWVLFRCNSLDKAGVILRGMIGMNGMYAGLSGANAFMLSWIVLPVAWVISWFAPNTWEIWRPTEIKTRGEVEPALAWTDALRGVVHGAVLAMVFLVSLGAILINSASPFLYFQF